MKKYYWVGLLFFAQIAYAGLFEDEEARKQLNSIQDQLNNIQANIQSNVDAKVTQALKNRNVNRTAINNQNALQQIQEMLSKLNGQVEVLQFKINNFQEREKVLYQEINDRLTILEDKFQSENYLQQTPKDPINQLIDDQIAETNEISRPSLESEALKIEDIQKNTISDTLPEGQIAAVNNVPPLIDMNIEFDAFDEAKAFLMSTKYKDSFSAFDRFVSAYPNSEKIADAKYYLGYSQFALKNYNAAIKTYSKVIESHANSPILPDAIYGIANCQIQLAKIANAKKTLRELIQQYPDADIISKAKRRLKALESINL
jgi:tol-pal system protein YbgF